MLRKKSEAFGKQLEQRNRALESFEEIANTYLKTSPEVGSKEQAAKKVTGARLPAWLPWLIAATCLIGALVVVVSRTYFDVKIQLSRKGSSASKAQATAPAAVFRKGDTVLMSGGQVDTGIIDKALFAGDAFGVSKIYSNEVILANADGRAAASYRLELKKPLDLSHRGIGYAARSDTSGAQLVLVITDTSNRGYRVVEEKLTSLSKGWRSYRVFPRPAKDSIDLSAISAIRFEFGGFTVGNPPQTTILLKDVYLTKPKRLKWL